MLPSDSEKSQKNEWPHFEFMLQYVLVVRGFSPFSGAVLALWSTRPVGPDPSKRTDARSYLLTLLQLPLLEVGNAMRAYCYSTVSYLSTGPVTVLSSWPVSSRHTAQPRDHQEMGQSSRRRALKLWPSSSPSFRAGFAMEQSFLSGICIICLAYRVPQCDWKPEGIEQGATVLSSRHSHHNHGTTLADIRPFWS